MTEQASEFTVTSRLNNKNVQITMLHLDLKCCNAR